MSHHRYLEAVGSSDEPKAFGELVHDRNRSGRCTRSIASETSLGRTSQAPRGMVDPRISKAVKQVDAANARAFSTIAPKTGWLAQQRLFAQWNLFISHIPRVEPSESV